MKDERDQAEASLEDLWEKPNHIERKVRRRCVNTFLDIIILLSLKHEALSGYDVITLISRKFNILISPGTVYPVLHTLHRHGLIEVTQTERRKTHTLTKKGMLYAETLAREYDWFYTEIKHLM